VTVRTDAGDCDRFLLGGPFSRTNPFPVQDVDGPVAPRDCDATFPNGDGIVVTPDDSLLRAEYQDTTDGWVARATVRVHCRNLSLADVRVRDGCETGVMRPMEPTRLEVEVENTRTELITGLSATLHPFDDDVVLPVATSDNPSEDVVLPGPGTTVTITTPAFWVSDAQPCPSVLRFRMEIRGDHGFRDRVYFNVPLECGSPTFVLPGEVPAIDDPPGVPVGMRVTSAMRAEKVVTSGLLNLTMTWDRPVGAGTMDLRYNIWRGELATLRVGRYSHAIPMGEGPTVLCNLPEADPMGDPGIVNTHVILGELVFTDLPSGSSYYLVTAEVDCVQVPPSGSIDGPWGFGNHDLDGFPDPTPSLAEIRPAGILLEPACNP